MRGVCQANLEMSGFYVVGGTNFGGNYTVRPSFISSLVIPFKRSAWEI